MSAKTLLLAAATLALVPTAAGARDGVPYIGLEGGAFKPDKLKLDYRLNALSVANGIRIESKTGWDIDFVAGYDLGLIRAEAELGMKRAITTGVAVSPAVQFNNTSPLTIRGRTLAKSAMANLLLDLGKDDGLQVYAGGGVGRARLSLNNSITGANVGVGRGVVGSDSSFAWQLIAGMRVPVSYNIDLGLKYRYFRSKLDLRDATSSATLDGRFRSNSILASLIFNLGKQPVAPEPVVAELTPPPPPPPPPTQTCPDGSVILATDACPVLPPPPPPPAVAPVRG